MSGRITTVSKPPKLERKKRVAAYARVSSGKDAMLHSLSAQVSHYSDLIQRNSDWLYAGVYADEAKTGTKDRNNGKFTPCDHWCHTLLDRSLDLNIFHRKI